MSQNSQDHLSSGSIDGEALKSMLHDVPLELSVELGRVTLNLSDLAARLGPGSIIPLNKTTGDKLDVRINGRLVARAEAVAVGERCGIRIVEIVSQAEGE
jgi:flagellar motor switch protein FliN